ncbi:MAG: DUF4349 domain-containing protein, partial [Acidimicrobiia bacterium]
MKRLLVAAGAMLMMVAACSAATADFETVTGELRGSAGATATTAAANTTIPNSDDQGETATPPTGVPAVADRKVIYDGRMELEALDTRAAFDRIVALVQDSGGYLAATTIADTNQEDEQPVISLTLRLPADRLTATLAEIRSIADRVVTESLQSQDVTDQFVDIEAQLRNLNALETELLALLAELRDNNDADPAKLLQVFDQIRATRGEIERLEGQRQMLTNLVSLATLQIAITPSPAVAPIVPADPAWEPATQAKLA